MNNTAMHATTCSPMIHWLARLWGLAYYCPVVACEFWVGSPYAILGCLKCKAELQYPSALPILRHQWRPWAVPRPSHSAQAHVKPKEHPPHASPSLAHPIRKPSEFKPPLSWDALLRTAALKRSLAKVKSSGARRVLDSLFGGPSSASSSVAEPGLGARKPHTVGRSPPGITAPVEAPASVTAVTVGHGSEPHAMPSTASEAPEHTPAVVEGQAEGSCPGSGPSGPEADTVSMARIRWQLLAAAVWSRQLGNLCEVSECEGGMWCPGLPLGPRR